MSLRLEFTPGIWPWLVLVLPLILIRFGLPALIDRRALPRLAYFPPVEGVERTALLVNQITNLFLHFYPFALTVKSGTWAFAWGLPVFLLGLTIYALAAASFARQQGSGVIRQGIYRISRNPMYVAYLLWLVGIGLLTGSVPYLIVTAVFQWSTHWLIRSEERWCLARYGEEYRDYMRRVPRYVLF